MDKNLDGALAAMEAELRMKLSIDGILPLLECEAGGFMVKEEKMHVMSVNRENTPEMVTRIINILRKKGNDEFYRFLDILYKSGNNVWANKLHDQMQTTVMQPGHSTVRNSTSRNPPVPGTMSQAQLAQQQQRNSPQLTDPAQLFQLLPSGLPGTANEPLTKEQLARIILEAKRQLLQSSLERDFGQDGGQRCISFHDLVNFCRGVFRIEINYRERNSICRGSGFFVEVRKGHWIVTACHNLLSAADGDLMKDGKWTDIKVLVEGKWCKIKTLDQGLQREALKVKMKANLKQAEFLLPDNEFVLTERQSLDQVIPDVGHLVFDPEDDILTIPCVDPTTLKLECGAKATAFHLDTDVMQHYVPAVTHCLAIVHCPWDMPRPEDWRGPPPRDIVQYNHGMLSVIDGSAIRYDMVTYPGSSGSPVIFCGRSGVVVVGVHRKSHNHPWNQCSHLTAEFITNEMLALSV